MRQLQILPSKMRLKSFKAILATIKRYLIGYLDALWNVIKLVWRTLIIGGIVVSIIGNAAYEYFTKGHLEFANITSLPVIQLAGTYPIITVCLILILSIILIASFLAHKYRQSIQSSPSQNEYSLQHVSQLNPSNYKLFRYIQHAYILRDTDTTVRNILRDISAQNHQNKTLGICIFGKPAQGKTRLAWEAMQAELANWTLVRWPHAAQVPFDFVAQQGKQIILWLDDLHEYANPNESVIITDLPRRFMEEGANLIVIATCRDGEDQLQATKYLGSLFEQLIPATLEDINVSEALNLAKILTQEGLEVSNDEFDGTPGSLIFGLQRMTSRYLNLTPSAQLILKAIKLLRSARTHTYSENRVKNVSHDVFGLEKNEWRKAYESLDRSDFIRIATLNNERIIEPVAEIYLEKVVIDYPTPHSMLTDDWINLKECFQRSKDAEGLLSLGLAANTESLRTLRETYQFSEECYNIASEIFLNKHNHLDWAGTQNNLGTLFLDQADRTIGDQAISLLNKGLEALNAALTVFSKENTPGGWVMVQHNLGVTLTQKARLVNAEEGLILLDNAIQIFQDILEIEPQELIANAQTLSDLGIALSDKAELIEKDKQSKFIDIAVQIFHTILNIHTKDHLPFEWARAQNNLGAALSEKASLTNNQEERRNLLNQTAEAHRAALTVYTKESIPLSWARTQSNLGSTFSDAAKLVQDEDRSKLLKEANEAYHAALTVLSKENAPILWSSTEYHLGNVLHRQARLISGQEEQLHQLHEAIQAYNAALKVYNKANFPTKWAMTQMDIGQALYYKATLLEGKEQSSLLEESIQAYHKALEIYTQENTKSAWSSTQHNLGISLHRQASLMNGEEQVQLLNNATQAYYAALEGLNKTDNSTEWALAQLNLSIALKSLILLTERQERQTLLDEGINASQAALSVYTHQNKSLNYAKAQHLLGTYLLFKELPSDDALQIEIIKAAINAFQSALEIFTKENNMTEWAQTQYDLGVAITSLLERLQNIKPSLIVSAISAFQSALEVYNPKINPREWAQANIGLAYTYYISTWFIEDKNKEVDLLQEAYRILESVATSYTSYTTQEEHIFPTNLIQQIKEDLAKIENAQ